MKHHREAYCKLVGKHSRATTPENGSSRRQPRSQGEECESETLILEKESALPRVSI